MSQFLVIWQGTRKLALGTLTKYCRYQKLQVWINVHRDSEICFEDKTLQILQPLLDIHCYCPIINEMQVLVSVLCRSKTLTSEDDYRVCIICPSVCLIVSSHKAVADAQSSPNIVSEYPLSSLKAGWETCKQRPITPKCIA